MTSYVNLIPLEKDKPRTPTHQEILIYKLERSLLFFVYLGLQIYSL